jgi:hypothetical protein
VKANLDLIESNESKDFIIQTLKRYSQILMRFNYLSELLISLYERMLRDLKGQEYCANAEVLGHIYLMNKQESNAHIIATEYAKYSKITDLTNQPDNVVAK